MTLLLCILLKSYPSASTIHYHDNRLYVMGDDATGILILDTNYQKLDSIVLTASTEQRIPKSIKADFESSIISGSGNKKNMILAGSCSQPAREKIVVVALKKPHSTSEYALRPFVEQLRVHGITEINLEGMTRMKQKLIFANRAHLANPVNHLVIVSNAFWNSKKSVDIQTIRIELMVESETIAGISELYYHRSSDILVFALTTEYTSNAIDDGEIGDSYLGYIYNFSKKLSSQSIRADELQNLSKFVPELSGQKIEGFTIEESVPGKWILHLAADNDNGTSTFFKILTNSPASVDR